MAALELESWRVDSLPIQFRVFRKTSNMINIHWKIEDLQCPTLSFINCIGNDHIADDILNGFDIDICRVMVNMEAGELCVRLQHDVREAIQHHVMQCVVKQGSLISQMQCPMARSIHRIEKYTSRGYRLQSLSFQSARGGPLKIDHNMHTVSWDVIGEPPVLVDIPSQANPEPASNQFTESQSRGSFHNHNRFTTTSGAK